jgi:hypothetical protein
MAVVAVAVGCGGGGESNSSGSTEASTSAEAGNETTQSSGAGQAEEPAAGGGQGEGISTSSLNKAQYVKKAAALCRATRKGLLAKVGRYLREHSSDEVSEEVRNAKATRAVILPVIEARQAVLLRLGAPAGDEEEIEAMIAGQESGLNEAESAKTVGSEVGPEEFFIQSNETFKKYGLLDCGYNL